MALWCLLECQVLCAEREHPFLFLTPADVGRARKAIRKEPAFAELARGLCDRATTNRLTELPPLERAWWDTDKSKPWSETYPQIWHHTFVVPMQWADLARNCARASLIADLVGEARGSAESSPVRLASPREAGSRGLVARGPAGSTRTGSASSLAAKARQILLGLGEYTFEFEHYDVGMNYTIWAAAALDAYDILYAHFTAAERARLDAFWARYLDAVVTNDDYWVEHEPGGKLNNHYAWHKLGRCMMGLFCSRPNLVREAWHGPKGVDFMLRHGFRDNGLWLEGSIPYQFAATAPMLIMAQILENSSLAGGGPGGEADDARPELGASLFGHTTADGRNLKQSYDALVPLLFPDRTLPTIGDCYGRRPHLAEHADWETLFRHFRDPKYAWLIRDRQARVPQALFGGEPGVPPAPAPAQFSALWPEMGYVALRSVEGPDYWSGAGWSLFATYSARPVHANADKLGIILFADGHVWLPDCEARPGAEHAFSADIQKTLNRETLCHNTLLVDGRSQRFPGRTLDLIEYSLLPEVRRVTLGDLSGQLYPGVRQMRTLIVREEYVVDFFQAQSAEPHEYAWLCHVDGRSVAGSITNFASFAFPAERPWSYLRAGRQAATADSVWETFAHEGQPFRLDLRSDGALEVVHGGFPLDDSRDPPTIPMRLMKRRGESAWFLVVYRRASSLAEPLEIEVEPGDMDSIDVKLDFGSRRARHTLPALKPGRTSAQAAR